MAVSASHTLVAPDVQATEGLGRILGELATPGLVIGLVGPLGAGKTTLARGIALGLGVPDRRLVSSPTYLLIQEYPGRLPLYHFDTYRLADPDDFGELGAEEYMDGDGVSVVEWADRIEAWLPPDRLEVALAVVGDNERTITLARWGTRLEPLWNELLARLGR